MRNDLKIDAWEMSKRGANFLQTEFGKRVVQIYNR